MMKGLVLYFCMFSLIYFSASGQYYPGGINYQAVARDNSGSELKNKNIDVRVSVISGKPDGDVEYSETTSVTTDGYGLFNFVIGQGSRFAGKKNTLADVNWGSAPHFLKVEVDFGSGYLDMNPLPLQAVPYALHAGTAANAMVNTNYQELSFNPATKILSLENGGSADLSSLNQNQYLSFNNGVLSLTNGNEVTINTNDADADSTNELQNLGYSNYTLTISKGNAVTIDNLLQDLQLSQDNKLTITNKSYPTVINLEPFKDNTDDQKLEIIGDSLAITGLKGGNKVKVDLSDTNEIQDLQINQHILTISNKTNPTEIDLQPYLDNTDDQKLSINGYDLSLDRSPSVNIRPEIIAFRAVRNGGNPLQAGESIELKFLNTTLNTNNVFDPGTGRFKVPQNGAGLYRFDLTYSYPLEGYSLIFAVNGETKEVIFSNFPTWSYQSKLVSYNIITDLIQDDIVSIYLKNTSTSSINCQPAILSGYRVH